jgi:hypothetical protein
LEELLVSLGWPGKIQYDCRLVPNKGKVYWNYHSRQSRRSNFKAGKT